MTMTMMMILLGWLVIITLGIYLLVRNFEVVRNSLRGVPPSSIPTRASPRQKSTRTKRLLIILGSGGHTTEMLSLLRNLPKNHYSPRIYITAHTDSLSARKAIEYESGSTDYLIESIPRSREVGQSYLTSIWTVLHAWFYSIRLLYRYGSSSIILCNGPGTGVPLCLTAIVLRKLGYLAVKIMFIESLARVHSLSLSGRILYPFVDRFLIQWPYPKKHYPHAEYYGILV